MESGNRRRLTLAEGRRFGFGVGSAFALLGIVFWWRGWSGVASGLVAIGISLAAAGALAPTRLGGAQRAWTTLARAMSRVTTPVLLAAVFFLVITPTGLMMRLMGRDPLRHRAVDGSFWKARGDDRGGMRNQF